MVSEAALETADLKGGNSNIHISGTNADSILKKCKLV